MSAGLNDTFIFHGKRHPSEMGKRELETFLTSLAVQRNVSASTQTQALSALLFLYKEVLGLDLLPHFNRHKQGAYLSGVCDRFGLLHQVEPRLEELLRGEWADSHLPYLPSDLSTASVSENAENT